MKAEHFIVAIPGVGLALIAIRHGGGFTGWASLLTVGVAVLLLLVVLGAMRFRARVGGRALGGFGPSGATEADLWRHENGHKRLLKKYGVGAGSQRVWTNRDGSVQGYTNVASWTRFERLPPEKQIAIYAAGGVAMGSHTHDGQDDVDIRLILKDVPWSERGRVEAEGRARARRDL